MKLLSRADFGLVGLTLAVNGVASTFSNFGFSSYIIQQQQEDKTLQSSIFWFNLFLGLVLCTAIIVSSQSIANFYKQPQLKNIIQVCSLFIPLSLTLSIPNALLSKRLQFKQINLRNIILAAFCAIVGISAALFGLGVWSLVLQQGLNLLLNNITSYKLAKWLPSFYFHRKKFKGAFDFGKYIFLATLVESVYSKLDVFTIGKLYKIESVGTYTRAQSLSGNVVQMSSKSLLNVLFPVLTKMRENKSELIKNYYNFFHHISFVFCLISCLCFVFAQPAFATFFKPEWREAALIFKIIILSSVVLPLSELMLSIIEARGNSKNYFVADIWKKVLLYPTYLMLFFFNLEVYLYTTFFGLLGALLINLYFLNKEIEVGYVSSCKIFLTYFLPTLAMSFLLDKLYPTENNWIFAILKFMCSAITLFITLKFMPSPTYQLILKKIKRQ
jgi:O-antigen/teichoic acid export membrane protein